MGYLFDTMTNFLSGLGIPGRDKLTASQYVKRIWTRVELEAAFSSDWIARKAITIPAHDATREWRSWQATQKQIEKLEATEERIGLQLKLQQALVRARLYGGACIFIGVDGNPAKELDPEKIEKDGLHFVHVFAPHELGVQELVRDISSPYYGQPKEYVVTDETKKLGDIKIHPSRMVRLIGLENPSPLENSGWGDPVLTMIHDAVNSAGMVTGSIATMVAEAKLDVIKIPGLTEIFSTTAGTNKLVKRFTEANVAKSVINGLVMDAEEEWQRIGVDFTGMPEVLQMYLQIAAGAADIPATRFLGRSPAGLNATGESDLMNYYDRIAAEQVLRLTPALEKLDKAVQRSALGRYDEAIFYEWNPLWQMDAKTKADIDKVKADQAATDAASGLVPFEALVKGRCNQLIEDGVYPGLDAAIEEAIKNMEALDEEEVKMLPPPGGPDGGEPPEGGMDGELEEEGAKLTGDAIRAWNEEKHQRVPKGEGGGGRFGTVGTGSITKEEAAAMKSRTALAALSGGRVKPKSPAMKHREASAAQAERVAQEAAQKEASAAAAKASKKPVKKEDFDKANIRIVGDQQDLTRTLEKWDAQIGMAPEEFKTKFLGGVDATMHIEHDGVSFGVRGTLQEDGRAIGEYSRNINPDKKEAYSAYFKLFDDNQGGDIGKKILGGNIETYEALGIDTVKVSANIDVGGYAWAKYGYVPTQATWNDLKDDMEYKLDRETGRASPRRTARRNENQMEAEEWSWLSTDQQDRVKEAWMEDTESDFYDSEVDSWREGGDPMEQAKTTIRDEFNNGEEQQWAYDAITKAREKLAEAGKPDIPYTDDQLVEALTVDYESRYQDGNGDVEVSWNDDRLNKPTGYDPNQKTLPGIEPVEPHERLTENMRSVLEDRLGHELERYAENKSSDMDPPEYLRESVREYQSDFWSQMDDSERLRIAERHDLHMIDAPEDEDAEEEEEPETEEAKAEKKAEVQTQEDMVRKAIASNDPKSIWKIADSAYGKKLLLNTGWKGVLKLKDKESYDRFKKYVGRVKKKEPSSAAA